MRLYADYKSMEFWMSYKINCLVLLLLLAGCSSTTPSVPSPASEARNEPSKRASASASAQPATPSTVSARVTPGARATATGAASPTRPAQTAATAATPSVVAATPARSTAAPSPSQEPATAITPPTPAATATPRPAATATAATAAAPQIRALWVDAFNSGFHTPEEVRQLVSDARRGNINTLIVQVRRRGDAFYRSSIEPRAETGDEESPVPDGFDPLQALLDQAHANGIEVHAWIASLPVWHWDERYQTRNPDHVWHRHGPQTQGRENWVMLRRNDDGSLSPTYSLDPGHPDAAQYTLDVSLDIIRSYDVDGLHLDYIRYGGKNEGYNAVAVERFNKLYDRTGLPAANDPDWLQWRREQVTALVRRLYVESYELKPQVKISAAVITWGSGPTTERDWLKTAAYARVLQDWRAWTEEGILDLAAPMNYFREYAAKERRAFDQWIEWEKNHQYQRQVLAGPGVFFNYIEDSLAQVRRALAPSASGGEVPGVSLYSYAATNIYSNGDYRANEASQERLPRPWQDRSELNQTFFDILSKPSSYSYLDAEGATVTVETKPVFPAPAAVPSMPWKDRPTSGLVAGQVQPGEGQAWAAVDGLQVRLEGPQQRTLHTDGNGWFGAAELAPGSYQATLTDRRGQVYQADVTVRAGQVTRSEFKLRSGAGARSHESAR